MKKHILLTTTAMLLSAVALKANADSNSATLDIRAMFLPPFEITEEQYLGFGVILANGPDKTVIVTTDGKLDPASTATMMSTASFTNYSNDYILGVGVGSFNEALFRINLGAFEVTEDTPEDELNTVLSVNFADTSVDLISVTDGKSKCGTVNSYTTRFKPSTDGKVTLHIGGTFTTNDLNINESHTCTGTTTVTIVLDAEAMGL